jgi:hypothetical protein
MGMSPCHCDLVLFRLLFDNTMDDNTLLKVYMSVVLRPEPTKSKIQRIYSPMYLTTRVRKRK